MEILNTKRILRMALNGAVILAFFSASTYVFAIDGTLGNKSGKSTFSTISKDLKISLKSGYTFHQNKSFGFQQSGKQGMFHSMMTYQKGNITYFLPMRSKPILNKFKTPSAPVIR